jgi:uncharacterized protein YqiB (DUF1249 family)
MVSAMKPTPVADMNLNQENYKRILNLIPMLKELKSATELTTTGATPLHIDLLYRYGETAMISLCQYCEHPAGYTVPDPSMMIAVCMASETVEALVFQNFLGTRCAYIDDTSASDLSIKATLNQFLGYWLDNLLTEGKRVIIAEKNTA